ncbi:MAG: hypothetical protein AB8F94_23930 [Saprospiraceae bacterium]
MKQSFVFTLIIALSLFLFSCGNDTNSSKETNPTTTETPTPTETKVAANHDDHAGHDHAGHNHDAPATVKASPLSPFFGIWKYTGSTKRGWFKNDEWIEFKRDMTFAYGQDGKELGTGKWFLEDETNFLTIDYGEEDKSKNEHWRAQINSPVLVLIGNTNISKSGEQVKMDKVEERPGFKK